MVLSKATQSRGVGFNVCGCLVYNSGEIISLFVSEAYFLKAFDHAGAGSCLCMQDL